MYIGRQSDILVRLLDVTGDPVLGLSFDEVEGFLWKQEETTWTPIGILPTEWNELDNGYYILTMRPELVDTLGPMAIKITGNSIADTIKEDIIEPLPPLFAIDASKCVVTGNIMDLTGDTSYKGHIISFILVTTPKKIGGVSLVTSDKVTATPDAFGNFSIMLLRGTTVMVEIERAGIKNQITIPDLPTANLVDLLPPF